MTQQPGFERPLTTGGPDAGATAYEATTHTSDRPLTQAPQSSTPANELPPHAGTQYGVALGTIIDDIKVDGVRMLKDNVALAKAEVAPMAKKGGVGAGLLAGAGYLALCLLALLFMAGGFGFAKMWSALFDDWSQLTCLALGYVTMAIALGIIAGILAMVGLKQLKQVKAPQATIDELKKSAAVFGESVKRGQQSVKANSLDRSALKQDRKAVAQQEKDAEKLRVEHQRLS